MNRIFLVINYKISFYNQIYFIETVKMTLWQLLKLCLQKTWIIIDKENELRVQNSKLNDTRNETKNDTNTNHCKNMISSLTGLTDSISDTSNNQDVSILAQSFLNASELIGQEGCPDQQFNDLNKASGIMKTIS